MQVKYFTNYRSINLYRNVCFKNCWASFVFELSKLDLVKFLSEISLVNFFEVFTLPEETSKDLI